MAAIKREPTPPGPISDLFDRLDHLHSKAGRPSVREIAIRAGRGNISPSTVHNVFHLARVPRWVFLERVVGALGGAEERETFLSLWEAAWRAENNVAAPPEAVADPVLSQGRAASEVLTLDLSILSKFEGVFGPDHERTLNARNNVAVDYRQLGLFREALEQDLRTYEDRRRILGADDQETLKSLSAVARDKRGLGRYQESLDTARLAVRAFNAAGGRENIPWLLACGGLATALRKAGHHGDALQHSEDVLRRCRDYLGADHLHTLQAATNLVNDRRAAWDLAGAEELARQTYNLCREAGAPDVLIHTLQVNLASVLRAAGRAGQALPADDQASRGFIRIYDDRHPYTLSANVNYASDLAQCGRLEEAIQVGHETLGKCRLYLGEDHPDTLMAAANLSLDETAAGDRAAGERRLAEVLRGYERTLTLDHPEARAAAQGTRLTAEIEPYDLLAGKAAAGVDVYRHGVRGGGARRCLN